MADEFLEDGEPLLAYSPGPEEHPSVPVTANKAVKGAYVSLQNTGFRDFLLKPELLKAINECGFEHPSEVQHECIPQAMQGDDVICQAKSGMGKTGVFVLSTLHQIKPVDGEVSVLVLCHTRELAFQISKEYKRFSTHMDPVARVSVFFGGTPIEDDKAVLKGKDSPHIVVGTPGRILTLIEGNFLKVDKLKHFIIDECDCVLGVSERDAQSNRDSMRAQVQKIFLRTPRQKQVMMFSATLPQAIRPVIKKFMHNPMEIFVDDETKLTLHGLKQHFVQIAENAKNRKLFDLLDTLDFNQVIIFVKSTQRCLALTKLLNDHDFPAISINGAMKQPERLASYNAFKEFKKRILVATDVFGRGMDIERVNIVVNYDMPEDSDSYLHRVARAGRFGTKGLAITFASEDKDAAVLNDVQARFEVEIAELPSQIDSASYVELKPKAQ